MKWHNNLLILFLILVLTLYGCGRGQSQPTGAPTDAFIGGTEGVAFEFERDAPPPEVTDGGAFPFKAILKLENKGEYKVIGGASSSELNVRIVGFNPADFNQALTSIGARSPLSTAEISTISRGVALSQSLEPKRRTPEGEVIDGGIAFMDFPPSGGSFNAIEFPGNTEFNFRAEVCYKYQTKAVAKLCILQNLIDIKPNALCNPNEEKRVDSSGSPVQVSNFRQNVVGQDKIVFSFDVEHSGSGTIYRDQGADALAGVCPRDDAARRRASMDKIHVMLTNRNIDVTSQCSVETDQFIRLIDGRRTVTCNLDLTGQHQTDYESLVNIQLDFNYDESKTAKVLVKHLTR